jgi:hypothetical protein
MGMVRPSSGTPNGQRKLEGRNEEGAPSADPRPFSHDSHFSVSAHGAHGYRLHAIDEIIVIGGNGQIVAVESPTCFQGERRRKGAMPVPAAALSKGCSPLRFLWGPVRSVLGLSGARPGTVEHGRAMDDHLKYTVLHHHALEGVGDIALKAFLRFLELQTPSAVADLPTIIERPRCNLAFRFQYDEHYLHERHAAQLAWKRFLTGTSPCGDQTPHLIGAEGRNTGRDAGGGAQNHRRRRDRGQKGWLTPLTGSR